MRLPPGSTLALRFDSAVLVAKAPLSIIWGHSFPFQPFAGTPHGAIGGSRGHRGLGGWSQCLRHRFLTLFLGHIYAYTPTRICANA